MIKSRNKENNKYHFFFGNLANPLRVEIITQLKRRDMSVSELVKEIQVEQSKLSHALANLRKCNLVKTQRKGKQVIYSLNRKTLLPILEIIDNHSTLNCGGNCAECKIQH
jgi:DNA-binding transcriptional ArsR family regulator